MSPPLTRQFFCQLSATSTRSSCAIRFTFLREFVALFAVTEFVSLLADGTGSAVLSAVAEAVELVVIDGSGSAVLFATDAAVELLVSGSESAVLSVVDAVVELLVMNGLGIAVLFAVDEALEFDESDGVVLFAVIESDELSTDELVSPTVDGSVVLTT